MVRLFASSCLVLAASFLLLVAPAQALKAVGGCSAGWLRSQAPVVAGCLFNPKGLGPCLANIFNPTRGYSVPSVPDCVAKYKNYKWPELRTTLDTPGYMPEQVWPYYRNLSAYPLWTQNVKAACASKSCDPAYPKPGDVLNVRVQAFPGTKIPRTFIPGAVVMEVRDGTKCVGLPGRCKDAQLWPPYRMAWGPKYFIAPGLDIWGYEHYFDLYPMKDATGKTIGTTISHFEFYTGIWSPVLMPPPPSGLGLMNQLRATVTQQNFDMRNFITTTLSKP